MSLFTSATSFPLPRAIRFLLEPLIDFGFLNILDACINNPPKTIVYASSSSIYGDQKKFPLNEKSKLLPINIYATSKILNEHIAEFYSKNYNTNFIGLRFFTVYGEWGRPDMFLLKIFNCFFKKSFFYLNNLGNHFSVWIEKKLFWKL